VAFSPLPRDGDTDQVFLHRAGMARPVGVGYPPPGDTIGIDAIAFRPDGRLLAVGDTHGTIRTWDISDLDHPQPVGAEQHGHTDSVTALAFAPDGRTLVSTSFDGSVRVWRLTAAGVASPAGHITDLGDRVTSAAFAPDGSLFATAGLDGALRLWDPATAAAAGPPIVAQDDRIATVRWSPDGSRLAVAGDASAGLIDLDPAHAIARVCASADWIGPDQWRTRVSPELPYTRIC
jgi:WD40 repeat protein